MTSAVPQVQLADFVRRASSGDPAAFAQLYDATAARPFGVALRVLRDRSHAEDVTQEAYLSIWRDAARFDPERGSVVGWIMMVVHGAAVNRVRSTQARANRELVDHQQSVPGREALDPTSELVVATAEARRVRDALANLAPPKRESIELAYFGGHTHTEVAALTGVAVGTAKSRIRDGVSQLRDLMDTRQVGEEHADADP